MFLKENGLKIDEGNVVGSLRSGVLLNVLLEEITDVAARVLCGRSYNPVSTTLEHILNNWDVLFDQLAELGAPLKKSAPATGAFSAEALCGAFLTLLCLQTFSQALNRITLIYYGILFPRLLSVKTGSTVYLLGFNGFALISQT